MNEPNGIIERIQEVVREPRADLELTGILILAVVVLLSLLVVLIGAAIASRRRRVIVRHTAEDTTSETAPEGQSPDSA